MFFVPSRSRVSVGATGGVPIVDVGEGRLAGSPTSSDVLPRSFLKRAIPNVPACRQLARPGATGTTLSHEPGGRTTPTAARTRPAIRYHQAAGMSKTPPDPLAGTIFLRAF